MKTLMLDRTAWDLVLDANGNIACGTEPYAIAQDVASAVKTFIGECWYNKKLGVPYFQQILGHWPPIPLVKSLLVQQALTVPGVVEAKCIFVTFSDRTLSGQIQVTDTAGVISNADF